MDIYTHIYIYINIRIHTHTHTQQSFISFLYHFSKLYPCGDCAREFRKILADHPPIVTDRDSLIQWLCKVHNIVNARLEKEIFPCEKVKDRWKCGCVDEV